MINIDHVDVLLENSGPGLITTWLKNENLWSLLFPTVGGFGRGSGRGFGDLKPPLGPLRIRHKM